MGLTMIVATRSLVLDLPAATEAVVPRRPLPGPAKPHLG
jgi:hypothetical protein